MRPALGLLLVLLVLLAPAAAQAQSNGTYTGTIACERMQGRAASSTPFQLSVEGAQAAYSREVLAVDGSPMGMAEEAKAPVAPDGMLVLASVIDVGSFHYEARYEGRLGEASGRLTGTQALMLGKDRLARKCTVTVSRRSAPTPRRPARPAPQKPAEKPAPQE